jgi:hypothetical protein
MRRILRVNTIIAHHLVMMGYGHWLGNDPRGSGSTELRAEKLEELGPIHFGRKKVQPSRKELCEFYREAEELLEHPMIWFDERMRIVIADAFGLVAKEFAYTVWSCAVLQNHAHEVLRVHRDTGELMWERMALASRDALRAEGLVPADHPAWSNRPYVVYKTTVPLVRKTIGYVEDNPEKHGLPRQVYPWVTLYDGWPHPKKR